MNYRSGMQKSQDVRHSSPAGNLHAGKPTAADRNRPPVKRSNQKYKQRNWKQQNEPHVSDGEVTSPGRTLAQKCQNYLAGQPLCKCRNRVIQLQPGVDALYQHHDRLTSTTGSLSI